jgi:hypothetical protein
MSKFLLNFLVQISKALVYTKINFYSEKNSPRHFRPTRPFGPIFFFFYRPIFLPSPTGPWPHSRPSRPARWWRPAELTPPPQEDASSHDTFALSSRPADRWTPPVILHVRIAQARPRHHHLLPLPVPPSPTSDAARAFTTLPSFPLP